MPKKSELIISHIVDRFLSKDLDYQADSFDSIADILDLPVYALKNVTYEDLEQYQKVFPEIKTIRDISRLDYEHPLNILIPPQKTSDIDAHLEKCELILNEAREKIGNMDLFQGTILISQMISRSWQKRSDYLRKKETKIITIGLDNAGKTAILSSLGGKLGLSSLSNLKPTKKVERKKISTDKFELFVWDFGGQEDYRLAYVREPEKYFLRTDLIIYVIDMQDPDRYIMSFEYFSQILDIMQRLSEVPYVLCYLHKSDPDIVADPDFEVNMEYVKDEIKKIMQKYPYDYDLYKTSIYNFFSSEPKFSRYIKDVMRDQHSLVDPTLEKLEGIGKILNTTMNSVIELANSVGQQIVMLNERVGNIEKRLNLSPSQLYAKASPLNAHLHAPTIASQPRPAQKAPVTQASKSSAAGALASEHTIFDHPSAYQHITQKTIASREELQRLQDEAAREKEMSEQERTRYEALKDLRSLFQKSGVVLPDRKS